MSEEMLGFTDKSGIRFEERGDSIVAIFPDGREETVLDVVDASVEELHFEDGSVQFNVIDPDGKLWKTVIPPADKTSLPDNPDLN